jgi:hypothetical protein
MGLGRNDYYVGRRKRRGVALPTFMSVGVLALAAVLFILLRPTIGGTVTDDYSGDPLANVSVTYGDQRVTTDGAGRFTLTPRRSAATLAVVAPPGYACDERDVNRGEQNLRITCRPTTLVGTIRRKNADTPLQGITIRATNDQDQTSSEAVSDENGWYELLDVPGDARLIVEGPGFARKEVAIGRATVLDLDLRPDVITGTVKAQGGGAIPGATVGVVGAVAATTKDGTYTLSGVPEEARVAARAPGYRTRMIEPGADPRIDFVLEPLVVKAIYLTPDSIIEDAKFNALLALVDRTELNAMVIDFKDESGWLLHESQVPLAREIGAVYPRYDLQARMKTLHEHNVYTIARVVCMFDAALATAKPELAVRNSKTGGIWKNANGAAWANAMRPEVWQYNTDIAVEAAQLGFDEVQYDYVRFPTDGDMDAIDLGAPETSATRSEAIHRFLKMTHDALAQYGVALGADIFGIALWVTDDNGIGQQLERIAPVVDYICPMIYPSHFSPGSLGYDLPNDHPYEVILESLQNGDARIADARAKFRPWLQDFTYGPGIDYGPNEVRAQIKATYDFGATGWMLWNANATFTEGALQPEKR